MHPVMLQHVVLRGLVVFLVAGVSLAQAATVEIPASKDNTLFEDGSGSLSNGAGKLVYAGVNGSGDARRGLLAFDIAGSIPANAVITGATLTLNVQAAPVSSVNFALLKVAKDWGEGTSDDMESGNGDSSTTGDATWIHTFFNSATWSSAGGDFAGTVSAVQSVSGTGDVMWSDAQMVADVQDWLDNGDNYGWLLRNNESTSNTVIAVASREDGTLANRPVLSVTFTPPDDYGDAPDSYGTLEASSGPSHPLGSGLHLGSAIDGESDGQPTADADGDDTNDTDDEDGIVFSTPLTPGEDATISATAVGFGFLSAWVDFNDDGDFMDPGEQVLVDSNLSTGTFDYSFLVPTGATITSQTFARFRFSTDFGLSPFGPASDGEVEDYAVAIIGLDFGDAPDPPYASLLSSNGARHALSNGLRLGTTVTEDADAKSVDTGDDGTLLPAFFVPGTTRNIEVITTGAGKLDAWFDFNDNGVWEASEQVFDGETMPGGTVALSVSTPADAAITEDAYARFRLSTAGGLDPTGYAVDGEVEDRRISFRELDYGDAPDPTYPTLQASDGARHELGSNLKFGTDIDADADGQPTAFANGDDTDGTDDEDGVFFTTELIPGETAMVSVTVSLPGLVNAWLDGNGDGDWDDPGEQIFTNEAVVTGQQDLSFTVPNLDIVSADTYARFRISTAADLTPQGYAPDGEVEDFQALLRRLDFGDAGGNYPTLLADDGARHADLGTARLGADLDYEGDGQPTASADGDDTNGTPDDEDGVTVNAPNGFAPGQTLDWVIADSTGYLSCWLDANGDGDWDDANELRFSDMLISGATNLLDTIPPLGATAGVARFRITDTADGIGPTGLAMTGEVEDYLIQFDADLDYGDAPDEYGTLIASAGARHGLGSGPFLGSDVTAETDGQPTADADADAEDDGLVFAFPVSTRPLVGTQITVSQSPAYVSLWIDFNGDGDWDDPGEDFIVGEEFDEGLTVSARIVAPGTTVVPTAQTYARIRVASTPVTSPTGFVPDGEVEDYAVPILEVDYGDAPDPTYPTLDVNDGAAHYLDGVTFLGAAVDGDLDGQPTANADGDDTDGNNDDDGVTFDTPLITGGEAQVTVTASVDGYVSFWLDAEQDGAWDSGSDLILLNEPVTVGQNTFTYIVPAGVQADISALARIRFSSQAVLNEPTGFADDGEVEDYAVTIEGIATIDCTGTTVADLQGAESGTDITINYLDPTLGGDGGKLLFSFTYPPEVDRITLADLQGFHTTLPAPGTSTSLMVDTVTDGTPDSLMATTTYFVTYDREVVPASGVYASGTSCQLEVAWAPPTCEIVFDPEFPSVGEPATADITLRNAVFSGGAYAYWQKDGGAFAALTSVDTVSGTFLTLNDAISIPSWTENDAGTYGVDVVSPSVVASCSVDVTTAAPPIDCMNAIVEDVFSDASGTDIEITYRDPETGGLGGFINFVCDHPAEVENIAIQGDDGFFVSVGTSGTQTSIALNSASNNTPDPDIDITTYTITYARPIAPGGNLVSGASCELTVYWGPPSCDILLDPNNNPPPGQTSAFEVLLRNARYDAANSRFGVLTTDASAGPASVDLTSVSSSGSSGVLFANVIEIPSWDDAANGGTYTVAFTGPGASAPEGTCTLRAGLGEGEGEGEGEAAAEGEGAAEGGSEGEGEGDTHSADQNQDGMFSFGEVLRVIQLYNSDRLGCDGSTEDGYIPNGTDETCAPHSGDYNPQDWVLSLRELLRIIQLFNAGAFTACDQQGEDGFCIL